MIDKKHDDLLEKVIRQDVSNLFDDNILPVQYDDIMGRRLNRVPIVTISLTLILGSGYNY